ncbi:MAG: prephenate dehydratase [Deltaproteobacteria bacterium]|uniref:Bifunctional chorismate mutase/prephenate dehydratase n=1 Tax=Candidatus Zymogenus saltonus TaxID=2844893 RepID=A0A9D8KDV7_9DELT|nr:prephenate dehydratase [Candidatus Zymogenus saltonus]
MDDEILSLLKKRVDLAKRLGFVKKDAKMDIFDPAREEEVLKRLLTFSSDELPEKFINSVYREIIGFSRSLQRPPRIAYLGPVASFTYSAALRKFGSYGEFYACVSTDDVFDAVFRKEADFGVVPVENSTEGIVSHTLDQFIESGLKISGEIFLRITFDLMSKTGKIEDIKKVLSHPHGLAQTRRWLSHNLPKVELVETNSTSEAALIASKDKGVAAIGSEEAGKIYELIAVERDIGDKSDNYTRFLVISEKSPKATGNDKTSILFSVKDKPGILNKVLGSFAKVNINLTKIESRPSRREIWDYVFFLDMEGHAEDKKVKRALKEINKYTTFVKLMGSYPRDEKRSTT